MTDPWTDPTPGLTDPLARLIMEPVTVGLLGLGALVALIAIRVPVAYAMIVVGGVGVAALTGPGIVLSQLEDLACGIHRPSPNFRRNTRT